MRLICSRFVQQSPWLNKSQDWQLIFLSLFSINIYFMSEAKTILSTYLYPNLWSRLVRFYKETLRCSLLSPSAYHPRSRGLNWKVDKVWWPFSVINLKFKSSQLSWRWIRVTTLSILKCPATCPVQCLMSRNVNKIFFADLEILDLTNPTHCLGVLLSLNSRQSGPQKSPVAISGKVPNI